MGSQKEPIKAGQTGYGTDFKGAMWINAGKLTKGNKEGIW